jgi:hypothetical protein
MMPPPRLYECCTVALGLIRPFASVIVGLLTAILLGIAARDIGYRIWPPPSLYCGSGEVPEAAELVMMSSTGTLFVFVMSFVISSFGGAYFAAFLSRNPVAPDLLSISVAIFMTYRMAFASLPLWCWAFLPLVLVAGCTARLIRS